MDYEKAYKDALERAIKLQENSNGMILKKWLWNIFPELRESEDERVRKWIIDDIRYNMNNEPLNNSEYRKKAEKAIDWLEKQGERKEATCVADIIDRLSDKEQDILFKELEIQKEQKSAEKVKSKFKVGDWTVSNLDGKARQISEVHFDEYNSYYVVEGKSVNLEEYDRLHHLWTIQDAKDGDVLYSPCLNLLWIFKSKDTVYCGCNLNYNDGAFCGEGYFERPTDVIPATKEHRDLLFQKMKEAGYKWDSEKENLKKIEQNP